MTTPRTITKINTKTASSPFSWTNDYVVSKEEAEKIANPEWIIENLVISGHIILIPAEPNAGKTTLFFSLAGEMVKNGYNVYYVNSDVSGGDAKYYIKRSEEMNIKLMLPDMKIGLSMNKVIKKLTKMVKSGLQFDKEIFIFDTLKKMVDVLNKTKAKELFKLLRKLSAKGMTVVLLAHTNKHNNDDGFPIYEGTGDMRADVDELIYLIPHKEIDGSTTITTKPDKIRGAFKPITFTIDKDRNVTKEDQVIDTLESKKISKELTKDQAAIDLIKLAIEEGNTNQTEVIKYCKEIGERTIKPMLDKYSSDNKEISSKYHYWKKTKGAGKSYIFTLVN